MPGECEQREARQPMLAHIIARDMRQARRKMRLGGAFAKRGKGGIAIRRDRAPAPGAAEVEPVEMCDLAVAAIGDGGGRKQRRGRLPRGARQEGIEPAREIAAQYRANRAALDAAHPVGRMGEPIEVGEVVASISSDAWSFVNGAYLPIDGGYLSR